MKTFVSKIKDLMSDIHTLKQKVKLKEIVGLYKHRNKL